MSFQLYQYNSQEHNTTQHKKNRNEVLQMNAYTFNKKWGKYGYNFYYVKCDGKYKGMVRNVIYCSTVFNNKTPTECDEYLTKNRIELECEMAKINSLLCG